MIYAARKKKFSGISTILQPRSNTDTFFTLGNWACHHHHHYCCCHMLGCLLPAPPLWKNMRQSWLPVFKKKKSITHKRLKERFSIGRNRTKCATIQGSPLFQATYNIKSEEKKTVQLILCQLDVGGWWKEMGKRLKVCFYVVQNLKLTTSSKMCMFCPVSSN